MAKWIAIRDYDIWEKDCIYEISEPYQTQSGNHAVVDIYYGPMNLGMYNQKILLKGIFVPLATWRENRINEILSNMTIFRYENSKEEVKNFEGPVIFLAGPTVRGNQYDKLGPSWRVKACELLQESGFNGAVVLPEFTNPYESDKGRVELPIWEHNGLTRADCILFWLPRTRDLWGLNTNSEHGFWLAKNPHKLVYGRPDDAFRIAYNDIMHNQIYTELGTSRPIFNTLEDTIKASINLAYLMYEAKLEDKRISGYHH